MRITDFKANLNKHGGVARTNTFMVELTGPTNSFIGTNELRMFCKTTTIPGLSIEGMEYKPSGFGVNQFMPIFMTPDKIDCIFLMDSNHSVMSFFHSWMQKIVSYDYGNGDTGSVNGQGYQEIGYKKDYAVRMRIVYYNPHNYDSFYEVLLDEAFPTQIGSVNLSWDDSDTLATLPVHFTYSKMSFSSYTKGAQEEYESLDGSRASQITRLGGLGRTVLQTSRPIGVQDAINAFTKLTGV